LKRQIGEFVVLTLMSKLALLLARRMLLLLALSPVRVV
jgi:hypothetical protein